MPSGFSWRRIDLTDCGFGEMPYFELSSDITVSTYTTAGRLVHEGDAPTFWARDVDQQEIRQLATGGTSGVTVKVARAALVSALGEGIAH